MRRRLIAAALGGVVATAGSFAQTPPPQQPPTFRAGVDIARTTVRVLDGNRQPIRGLTDKDFTVFVNGVIQPIVAVVADEELRPVVPSAPWMRDVVTPSLSRRST